MATNADSRLQPRPSAAMRLLKILVWTVVVVAILWTVAWFAAAGYVERQFEERTATLAREGRADIACGRHDVTGFPLRFRFVCDEDVAVETDRAEVALASLDAHASLLAPSTIHGSAVGPANLVLPDGGMVMASWDGADLTVRDAFDRRSFQFDLSAFQIDAPRIDLAGSFARFALRPKAADLLIELDARGVSVIPEGSATGELSEVFADITLEGLHRRLLVLGRPFEPANGLNGTITTLGLEADGGGRMSVSGPFSVSPDGLISGDFLIAVRDPESLAQPLADLTGRSTEITGALTALEALGQPRTIGGEEMRAIELSARNGKLPLGFITIDLPRVWQPPEGS